MKIDWEWFVKLVVVFAGIPIIIILAYAAGHQDACGGVSGHEQCDGWFVWSCWCNLTPSSAVTQPLYIPTLNNTTFTYRSGK